MGRTEAYELIDKKLEEGQAIEEIYIEYDTLVKEELEKPIEEKTKEDEYLKIRDAVAMRIVHDILREKGYTLVEYKKFGRWEKMKEEE